MNLYELTYVLRSDLEEDALNAVQERISGRLKDAEGELVKSEGWGRRRLAYPIDRVREGFYFTSILKLPGTQVRPFENQLKLVPEVLRFLLIRQEEQNINLAGSLLPASHRPTVATPVTADEQPAASSVEGETAVAEGMPEGQPSKASSEAAAPAPETPSEAEAAVAAEKQAEPEIAAAAETGVERETEAADDTSAESEIATAEPLTSAEFEASTEVEASVKQESASPEVAVETVESVTKPKTGAKATSAAKAANEPGALAEDEPAPTDAQAKTDEIQTNKESGADTAKPAKVESEG